MTKVLILGATSAIAQATARLMADRGDQLFLVARGSEKLEAVVADMAVRGNSPVGRKVLDLDRLEEHESLLDEAESFLGGLDLVLIAYGTLGDQASSQADWSVGAAQLHTNFLSAASLLSEIANRFEARGSGTIIAISSVAGDRGRSSNYVYGTAKAALSTYLAGLRNRLHATGVRVLTVKPGFVATPMTAHLKQGFLFASPEAVGRGILRAFEKKKDVVYLPWFWRYIMLIIRTIPEFVFKRLQL